MSKALIVFGEMFAAAVWMGTARTDHLTAMLTIGLYGLLALGLLIQGDREITYADESETTPEPEGEGGA